MPINYITHLTIVSPDAPGKLKRICLLYDFGSYLQKYIVPSSLLSSQKVWIYSLLGLGALIGHLKKTIRDHSKKKEENQVHC